MGHQNEHLSRELVWTVQSQDLAIFFVCLFLCLYFTEFFFLGGFKMAATANTQGLQNRSEEPERETWLGG